MGGGEENLGFAGGNFSEGTSEVRNPLRSPPDVPVWPSVKGQGHPSISQTPLITHLALMPHPTSMYFQGIPKLTFHRYDFNSLQGFA